MVIIGYGSDDRLFAGGCAEGRFYLLYSLLLFPFGTEKVL